MARRTKHTPLSKKRQWSIIILVLLSLGIIGATVQLLRQPLVPSETIVDYATTQQDVAYCGSYDAAQTLDFYRPKSSGDTTLPLVVYIHGGGWKSGSKRNALITHTYGPFFLQHNIAVASIDYRIHTPHAYPDQNKDVSCALNYLYSQASTLKIDPNKTIIFGDSAGGQLAAFAALHPPYGSDSYTKPVGVIDFYGVSDFSTLVNRRPRPDLNARHYLGPHYNDDAAQASPITHVTASSPHFLIIHGTKDGIVPIAQSKELYEQLTEQGNTAYFIAIPGAKHGFIGPELPNRQYETIQNEITTLLHETGMIPQ